jgi:hypothetical protein
MQPEWNSLNRQKFYYKNNALDSIFYFNFSRKLGSIHLVRNPDQSVRQVEGINSHFNYWNSYDYVWFQENYTINKPKAPLNFKVRLESANILRISWVNPAPDAIQFRITRRPVPFLPPKFWSLPAETQFLLDTLPRAASTYENLDYFGRTRNKYAYSDHSETARWNGDSEPPYYSIDENSEKAVYTLYPSPNTGHFHVELENSEDYSEVRIFNQQGVLVYAGSSPKANMTFDISKEAPGTHLFVLSKNNSNSISIRAFIKN